MTRNEAAEVISAIKTTYPKFYEKTSPRDIEGMLNIWASIFADYSLRTVMAGLQAYIVNDEKGFPPVPGQVIAMIRTASKKSEMSALEAWAMVRKAVQNSNYHAEEEYDRLPEAAKTAVGGAANLREMAMMDIDTFESVEQSHFIRTYNAVVKRQQAIDNIPSSVRSMIQSAEQERLESKTGGDRREIAG